MADDKPGKIQRKVHEVDLKQIRKEAHILPFEKLLGTNLFDRPHPKGYTEEWLENLKKTLEDQTDEGKSALIFRLNNEWLALSTQSVKQVTESGFIHRLPHIHSNVILGLMNIEGELRIVISLKELLGFNRNEEVKVEGMSHKVYSRMVLFGHGSDNFVFKVDEVYGTTHFKKSDEEETPLTVSKSLAHYSTGLFRFKKRRIGLLDEHLIIDSINESHL